MIEALSSRQLVGNITSYLILFIIFTVLFMVFQFYWSQRRLYAYTAKLPCLPTVPILGNCHAFIGVDNSVAMHATIIKYIDDLMDFLRRTPVKFWMGPIPVVGIARPEDLQIVLNSSNSMEKAIEFYSCMKPMMGIPILYKPVSIWKRHRKLFHSSFSKIKCYNMVEKFIEPCNEFLFDIEKLQSQQPKGIDSEHFSDALDLAVAKTVAFLLIGVKSYDWSKLLRSVVLGRDLLDIEYQRMCKFWLHSDFLFKFTKNYQTEIDIIDEGTKIFEWFIETRREMRLKNEYLKSQNIECDDETYFIDILFEMMDRGELNHKQLKDELILFLGAGTDTTNFATYLTLLMIAMYPDVQEKVYQEVESIFQGSNRPVTANDLKKAKYLNMVNKEAMRLFSPIPVVARRATDDIVLEHCTIPSGSVIFPFIHAVHKNPDIWPEPDKFDPERFHPDNLHTRHPYSFIPFSAGPRNCIGYEFATFFMKTIILMVVRKYKLTTECTHSDIKLKLILTTKVSSAKPITFTERHPKTSL